MTATSSDATGRTPPPGWYPDPEHRGNIAYWDGKSWVPESSTSPSTPAGWYKDPSSGKLRYWDSTAWEPSQQQAAQSETMSVQPSRAALICLRLGQVTGASTIALFAILMWAQKDGIDRFPRHVQDLLNWAGIALGVLAISTIVAWVVALVDTRRSRRSGRRRAWIGLAAGVLPGLLTFGALVVFFVVGLAMSS